jgi:hypothetical protein
VALLLVVLMEAASFDVRNSPVYLLFYTVLGVGWLVPGMWLLAFLGVSSRDDLLERRNPAAGAVCLGWLAGATLAYAGANIGDGPGFWVVIYCSILSTLGLAAAWFLPAQFADAADVVTIERDFASGVRLAGMLIAAGLILGRSVAGDWEGYDPAFDDFVRLGWPVLLLAGLEVLLCRVTRPTPQHPRNPIVSTGFVPAFGYLAAAFSYVAWLGAW